MNVLITGASKGIGRALAMEMVAKGHTVWGAARTAADLQLVQDRLGEEAFRYTAADLSTTKGIDTLLDALDLQQFYPDYVYLNAGIYSTDDSTFTTEEHYIALFDTNMHGPIELFRKLQLLDKAPTYVVLISSLFALLPDSVNPAYSASKAGVTMALQSMALNYTGLQLKIVYMGPVDTAVNSHAAQKGGALIVSPQRAARFLATLPSRSSSEFVFPFTSRVFFGVFSRLPRAVYQSFMKKARR